MRIASVMLAIMTGFAVVRAGENVQPMRGDFFSGADAGTTVSVNGVAGIGRTFGSGSPLLEPIQPESKEYVTLKLPAHGAGMTGRARLVVINDDDPEGILDFAATDVAALRDEAGIPGLVPPELLAIDKYSFVDNKPLEDAWRRSAAPMPAQAEPSRTTDIASMAVAFPNPDTLAMEIEIPTRLFPAIELLPPYGTIADWTEPALPAALSAMPGTETYSTTPAQNTTPPWQLATLPRAEVFGLPLPPPPEPGRIDTPPAAYPAAILDLPLPTATPSEIPRAAAVVAPSSPFAVDVYRFQ